MSDSNTLDRRIPLHRQEAYDFVQSEEDALTRSFLDGALQDATIRFLQHDGVADEDYERRMPAAPFDLLFYVQVLRDVFRDTRGIVAVDEDFTVGRSR